MDRLVKILEQQVQESHTSSYEVGEQRERGHRYYTLQPLGNEQKGRSHYISPDVMDAVEAKKAFFSESFLTSRQPVKFTAGSNAAEADAKTAYVVNQLRRNNYERLFKDAWHDAFVAKRCVFLTEWENDSKEVEIDLPAIPQPQLEAMIAQTPGVISADASQMQRLPSINPMGQVYNVLMGTLVLEVDDSYPCITLCQPERYFRDPQSTYVDEGMWATYEEDIARGTLKEMGYDHEQVERLAVDYRFRSEEEDAARKRHDSSWTRRRQMSRVNSQEIITHYRTWTWLEGSELDDFDLGFEPPEELTLYRICWAHGEVLIYEDSKLHAVSIAEEMPFDEWAEMKISHAEMGMCTSDVMAHTQKTQSTLKRLIIDNQQMRNTTRYEAVRDNLLNPRDLLDTAIGGAVWSKTIGSVAPLATPELSPLTMGVVQMLKADGEERSGVTGLGKGMNTDAVKYQNSDRMIERLTNAGNRRIAMQARDFARTCYVPLCQRIAHLGMRNDLSSQQLEAGGRVIDITPQNWSDEGLEMEVAVALTPDEAQTMAQQLVMMHTLQSQDEDMRLMYSAQQKHALFDRVYDLIGVKDSTPFLVPPESPQYQQQAQGQQQAMQQQQQKQEFVEQFRMNLMRSADQREWQKERWTWLDKMQDNVREDEKLRHEVATTERELDIEEEQERPVAAG